MAQTLYDRTVEVRFPNPVSEAYGTIAYTGDQGPRIAFKADRSMRAHPDRATVRIWNLPEEYATKIVDAHGSFKRQVRELTKMRMDDSERAQRLHAIIEQYIVEIWVGYGSDVRLMFRGDMIRVAPRQREGLDYVTEIELGDGFVVFNEQQMASTFGVGTTPENLLAFAASLMDATKSDAKMRAVLATVAPNAASAKLANGYVAQGRPFETIKEIADLFQLQWWFQNGEIKFVRRDQALPDFAIALDERSNVLSYDIDSSISGFQHQYHRFTAILTPLVHPGRYVFLRRLSGEEVQGRVLDSIYTGDTHGNEWTVSALMDDTSQQNLVARLAP